MHFEGKWDYTDLDNVCHFKATGIYIDIFQLLYLSNIYKIIVYEEYLCVILVREFHFVVRIL